MNGAGLLVTGPSGGRLDSTGLVGAGSEVFVPATGFGGTMVPRRAGTPGVPGATDGAGGAGGVDAGPGGGRSGVGPPVGFERGATAGGAGAAEAAGTLTERRGSVVGVHGAVRGAATGEATTGDSTTGDST